MTALPAEFSGKKWEAKLLELARGIIQHGYGQLTFSSSVISGNKQKIVIQAGQEYIFFTEPTLTNAPTTR